MLKVPSFILGGILILTGLVGYLAQDLSLSIKLEGPWASDAEYVLSDGDQDVLLDFMPCDDSAGENVWWIVHKVNEGHAKQINADNYARSSGRMEGEPKSFWYASSTGETLKGMLQESENYSNAGTEKYQSIPWAEIGVDKAKIRFIYNNMGGVDGPVTLTSNNWENVIDAPEAGESLEFGKSWTAFIPGIIGLILILLAVAADKAPNAKKHIMHVAVLIALLGFLSIAKMVFGAFAEMSWWRSEPYLIYEASSLKPTTMLLSAGLLLIYVILCVVSFITARKEMAAQAARDAAKKAAVLKKASKRESLDDESRNDSKKTTTPKDSKSSASKPKAEGVPSKDTSNDKSSGNNKELNKGDDSKPGSISKDLKTEKSEKKDESSKTSSGKETPTTDKGESDKKNSDVSSETKDSQKASDTDGESKNEESSKAPEQSKDSSSSNDSTSKDQESLKKENEEEKPQPKADVEKSDKE